MNATAPVVVTENREVLFLCNRRPGSCVLPFGALPHFGLTRLVAVTGYGQTSDRQRTAAAGFHQRLVKPVDLGILADLVADIASGHALS